MIIQLNYFHDSLQRKYFHDSLDIVVILVRFKRVQ